MTREIPLHGRHGDGRVALVDDADYERLSAFRWSVEANGYAAYSHGTDFVKMHRLILGLVKGDGLKVDHVNRDPLDNRKANLRIATKSQNAANMQRSRYRGRPKSGKYKGVEVDRRTGLRISARIMVRGERRYLGAFQSERDAALAYDAAAREAFGEFARTNFP